MSLASQLSTLSTRIGVEIKAVRFPPINAQTGTTYTLVLADGASVVTGSNASAQTYTVPPNASVAFPVGAYVEIIQLGAGQITLAAGAGVTLNGRGGALKLAGQYAVAGLRKVATNTWIATGDLTT